MHILHVVPYFYPAWAYGGIPRLVYGLARAQYKQGHRVSVLTTDAFDQQTRLPSGSAPRVIHGIDVITMPNLSNRLAYHHQAFLPVGMGTAFRRIETSSPDILHLHGHRHLLNNAARTFALRHNLPYVLTPNGTLPAIERKIAIKAVFDLVFGRKVIRDAQLLIAVSRAEVAQFRQAGVPPGKVVEIPNGLDLAEFDPAPGPEPFRERFDVRAPFVLYLGKLTPRKGVDHLIRAMARVSHQDVVLVVAGNDMGVARALRRTTREIGLEHRVRFVGLLTGEDRLSALAGASLLVYPSTQEIFGLVPFEGLLAGTPAVVVDDCGCGELVQKAGAGLLVPFADPDRLAHAIDTLLDDPERCADMVTRGRQFIRNFLAWDRIGNLTLEAYQVAVTRARGRRHRAYPGHGTGPAHAIAARRRTRDGS